MNQKVISVKPIENYHILLEFDNGIIKMFDISPYLDKGIFTELKSSDIFNSVKVNDGTVQWINEADFCPDTLYAESIEVKKHN